MWNCWLEQIVTLCCIFPMIVLVLCVVVENKNINFPSSPYVHGNLFVSFPACFLRLHFKQNVIGYIAAMQTVYFVINLFLGCWLNWIDEQNFKNFERTDSHWSIFYKFFNQCFCYKLAISEGFGKTLFFDKKCKWNIFKG